MSLKSHVESIAQDVTGQMEHLPETLERVGKEARGLTKRATQLIQEHPVQAVLGAFAVGFLIAQVAKRV